MQIVVNEYGSTIRKEGNRFVIANNGQKEEFSAENVSQIIIAAGTSISANVIKLAMSRDIDIVYVNKYGKLFDPNFVANLIRPGLASEVKLHKEIEEEFAVIEGFGTSTVRAAAGKIKAAYNSLKTLIMEHLDDPFCPVWTDRLREIVTNKEDKDE